MSHPRNYDERELALMEESSFSAFRLRLNELFSGLVRAIEYITGASARVSSATNQLRGVDDYTFDMIYELDSSQLIVFANSLVELPDTSRGSLNSLLKLQDEKAVEQSVARYGTFVKKETLACVLALSTIIHRSGFEVHRTVSPGEFPDLVFIDRAGPLGLIYMALRPSDDEKCPS